MNKSIDNNTSAQTANESHNNLLIPSPSPPGEGWGGAAFKTFLQQPEMHMAINNLVQDLLQHSIYANCQCLSVAQCAELVGVKEDTIRDWIKAGKLEAHQPGKEYLVRVINLHKLLEQNSTIAKKSKLKKVC